jgi:trigger factor
MLEQTMSALARQGISKENYLRIADKDEESMAHEAEPEAASALRREAVLAAIVEAESITPSDEQVAEALEPVAERGGTTVDQLMEQLRSSGRLEGVREDVASRQAVELLVREAAPITVEQAKARQKLWTPGKDEESSPEPTGRLWTPGS